MSNEWDIAFGGTKAREDVSAAGPASSAVAPGTNDFTRACGDGQWGARPEASPLPREAGLLSDEAAAAFKLKVTETGKRLAESLGKGAACTTSVARQLSRRGSSRGRTILIQLKRERVGRRCVVACGVVVGMAAVAAAAMEWQTQRPVPAVGAPTAAHVAIDHERHQFLLVRRTPPNIPSLADRFPQPLAPSPFPLLLEVHIPSQLPLVRLTWPRQPING